MILAIETSSSVCAVGFYSDGQMIAEYKSNTPMKHSELVGTFVEKGLKEASGESVRLVVVAIGPGSFTGLRIGISYAQGFCFGQGIPAVGISNHQLLAKKGNQKKEIFTVIDAHRQELYLARHRSNDLMEIESHTVIKRADILKVLPSGSQLLFVKGTWDNEKEVFSEKRIVPVASQFETSVLAELGRIKYSAGGGQDPRDLQPMYIRSFAGVQ